MLPLALAIPPLLEGLTAAEIVGAAGIVGGLGLKAYLGFETVKTKFGSAPTGLNSVPVTFPKKKPASVPVAPVVPAVPTAVAPALDAYSNSQERQKANTRKMADAMSAAGSTVAARNAELADSAAKSKFLTNQVASKAALDDVSFAINAQSVVMATIYETLDRNLSLISSSLVALAEASSISAEKAFASVDALSTISDRLEPFQDNQEFARTELPVLGLETVGEVSVAAPRVLAHARDFEMARDLADSNSIAGEHISEFDDILEDVDIDAFRFLRYVKVSEHLSSCVPDTSGVYPDFDWSSFDVS